MAITDEQAIAFAQAQIRPMAEMLRWMQHAGNDMVAQWNAFGGVAMFANDAGEIVMDDNQPQHPFTGADASTVIGRVTAILAILNAAYAMDGVLPACVRPLSPASGPGA